MSAATVIFKAIDYMFDLQQNPIGRTKRNMKNVVKTTDIVYDESDKKACTLDTFVIPKRKANIPLYSKFTAAASLPATKNTADVFPPGTRRNSAHSSST